METSRVFLLLGFFCDFLILRTHQLQSSQTQVLKQLRKQLEYPKQLDFWVNPGTDLCFLSSPEVNITCEDNSVTEIKIFGDRQARFSSFNEFPVSNRTLSQKFSMDSLVATLSRLNGLRVLSLVSLGIWGSIPDQMYRLQSLEYLDFSWNFLYGSIPRTISRFVKFQVLKLDGNFLNGSFPDWFDSLSYLTSVSLRSNRFSGPLPSSIHKVASLTDLNLSNNGFDGKLPDLNGLSSLHWLDLSNNRFDSALPTMPNGVIAVLLANNSFSGSIPKQYIKLNQLQQLDLSFNVLTEAVPDGLFGLSNIVSINLASNLLTGSLPMDLSCGRSLESLNISNNRLVGLLPSCLNSSLKNKVIQFGGNCLLTDLQEQHLGKYCSQESPGKNKSKNVTILICVFGGIAVVLVLLAAGFLVFYRRYCCQGTSEQHLLQKTSQENSVTCLTAEIITSARYISNTVKLGSQDTPTHRLFSLDELKAATCNFESPSLIGEGSTGKLYKGKLENGAQVAIRCLTLSRKYPIRNLKLRLDLLSKLRHPHLVCLLGHCIETEGRDEHGASNVYLIYEYISNGNYRDHLSETNLEKGLKWSDRLAILIGIARAVHFLHTGIIPGFYSNRLKTNNILINEHLMGKLSDYGLSVVAQELNRNKEEDGLKSWQMKSLEDDVYSFGFILLESLIGPSFCARKESLLPNQLAALGTYEGQRRIIDPIVLASSSHESLSVTISLTINCISSESSSPPPFEDVLWNLEYAAQLQANPDGDKRTGDKRAGKSLLSP